MDFGNIFRILTLRKKKRDIGTPPSKQAQQTRKRAEKRKQKAVQKMTKKLAKRE